MPISQEQIQAPSFICAAFANFDLLPIAEKVDIQVQHLLASMTSSPDWLGEDYEPLVNLLRENTNEELSEDILANLAVEYQVEEENYQLLNDTDLHLEQ